MDGTLCGMEWAWVVVCISITLIGVTKSGFGSGVGLLNVPMIVLAMKYTDRGSQAALGLMLPLLILGDLIAVWQYRRMFVPQRAGERQPVPQPEVGEPPSHGPATIEPTHPQVVTHTGPQLIKALLPGTVAGVVLGGLLLW